MTKLMYLEQVTTISVMPRPFPVLGMVAVTAVIPADADPAARVRGAGCQGGLFGRVSRWVVRAGC